MENLHKTGNPDPLAFVLGLLGDEQGGVNDEEGGHLGNLGVDIESGKVYFNENQFTLSHNAKHPEKRQMKTSCDSKLDPSFKKIEEEQTFVEATSVTVEDSHHREFKDENTNTMAPSRFVESHPLPLSNRPKKRERFHCEQCNKMLVLFDPERHMKKMHSVKLNIIEKPKTLVNCNVCNQSVRGGWNLKRHTVNMHSVQGDISCTKDFCDSTFQSEYDMKVHVES